MADKTETIAIPTHINGRVVLAAVRVPSGGGELAYQWFVVCEDVTMFIVWHVGWNGGAYSASHGDYDITTYDKAVKIMLDRAGIG